MAITNDERGAVLRNSPFYILDVDCSAGRRQIVSAAEDRSFMMDPDQCNEAQNALLNPAKRLTAELDWFPEADARALAQIRNSVDSGNTIPEMNMGALSMLNVAIYNFSLEDCKDRNRVIEGIKRLDKRYSDLNAGSVTDAINRARQKGGVGQVERRDVEQGLQQKRYQIRQLIAQKLNKFSELACMSLMTQLANKYIGSKDYPDGVILSDAVTEYEVRVQASLDRDAEGIEAVIAACRKASNRSGVEDQIKKLENHLRNWAGMSTPMTIRAQASGMPYQKADQLAQSIRELSAWLHNEKDMTDVSIQITAMLRRMFSGHARVMEALENDEKALEKANVASKIKDDLERLVEVAQEVQKGSVVDADSAAEEIMTLTQRLNRELKEMAGMDPQLLQLREMVYLAARSASVEMHNRHSRTDLACNLSDMLKREFSDIAKFKSQIEEENKSLQQQLVLWRLLKNQSGAARPQTTSSTNKESYLRLGRSALDRKDYRSAFDYFKKSADMGSAEAMNMLGLMYHRGQSVTQDYNIAMNWYRKAADKGLAVAMNNIGNAYLNGWGVQRDPNQGAQWLQKASDAGYVEASNALGKLYYEGKVLKKDARKATELFQKAAKAGDASGMWNYACMAESGSGMQKDLAAARQWFAKAADKGHEKAPEKAADMYERGIGGPVSMANAREYRTKCANSGDRNAIRRVAAMYAGGEGGNVDMAKAIEFQSKLVANGQGSADDHNTLGEYYRKRGLPQDLKQAEERFATAARMGSQKGERNLQELRAMQELNKQKARSKRKRKFLTVLVLLVLAAVAFLCVRGIRSKKGMAYYESGDYAAAAEHLRGAGSKYSAAYMESCYHLAVQYAEQGNFTAAAMWLQESGKTGEPLNHYVDGMRLLDKALDSYEDASLELEQAETELKAAGTYGKAQKYLKLVRELREGTFTKAVGTAKTIEPALDGMFTPDRLIRLMQNLPAKNNADKALRNIYLDALKKDLNGDPPVSAANSISQIGTEVDSCYSGMEKVSGSGYQSVGSLASIERLCNGNAGDKVLIVRQYKPYKGSLTCDIYLEAMELLPLEYLPSCLAEVRYILVVEYNYQDSPTGDYGWGYTATTQGIQEYGSVDLIDVRTDQKIYRSGKITGPDSPQSFSYSGAPPAYKSGGAPNLKNSVAMALKEIM